LVGTKDVPDNDADECVAKVCANMLGKLLDSWIDLLPDGTNDGDPWKWVNRASVLHLVTGIISGERK